MKILGGDKSDKNINNHNIYIGISLGNKFFDENNLVKYIKWGIENTNKYFCILIADDIQKFNYIWLRKYSLKKAENQSLIDGEKKRQLVKNIIDKYFTNHNIKIISWNDLIDINYEIDLKVILEEYNKKGFFYEDINNFVSNYIKKLGRTINEKSIFYSSQYILREIPFLVKGFKIENEYYSCYPYPIIGVGEILMNIQNDKYSDLAKLLNIQKYAIQVVLK